MHYKNFTAVVNTTSLQTSLLDTASLFCPSLEFAGKTRNLSLVWCIVLEGYFKNIRLY